MIKFYSFAIPFLLFFTDSFAQMLPADTSWTKCLGGSGTETPGTAMSSNFGMNAAYVAVDSSGNFYTATCTNSSNGYVNGNSGLNDIWLLKISPQGDTLWTKRFGGSGDERVYRIRSVSSGGIIMLGKTQSNDGDFTGSHGQTDAFIIRVSADGNTLFNKLYGGADQDYLYDITENPDGNFVACGETGSNDGDLNATGSGLGWVLFINGNSGTVSSSVTFEGPDHASANFLENLFTITRLADGTGYIAAGYTSPDFSNSNADNIWVLKFNFAATVIWSKKYGSITSSDYPSAVLDAGDGQFYIVASTSAAGGNNTSGYFGGPSDGWLIKCDATGNILWNKNYGGTNWDAFYDGAVQSSGNILLSGFTRSSDNDLSTTTPRGLADYWLVQVSGNNGSIIDMKRAGGSAGDFGIGMAYDSLRNNILMVGRTESTDGCVHGNNGGRDLWIVCYSSDEQLSLDQLPENNFNIIAYPNPVNNLLTISSSQPVERIELFNSEGIHVKGVICLPGKEGNYHIETEKLSKGYYLLNVITQNGNKTIKLIKD
jgi:hypothetical protein